MFRYFENLVAPFQAYAPQTPPSSIVSYLALTLRPLRHVVALSLVFTALSAAIEIWLIYYAGRLIDLLASVPPENLWRQRGTELFLVAALLLVVRPAIAFIRESLDDLAFRPNAVSLMRWRAHRHLLGQSVGWFQNRQAGSTAIRVRELGSSATGAAYQIVHTLSYVIFYLAGSLWLMASIDLRLVLPLALWVALYLGLMVYAVPRFRDMSERFQNALSALTGTLVDTYANIDTIKLFADPDAEDRESRQRFEAARNTFLGVQRFEVIINASMIWLSNLLMVALVGYGVWLWQLGDAPLGLIAAALALSLRISGLADWMLDAVSNLFGFVGASRDALETIAQPLEIADAPGAPDLAFKGGAIKLSCISHHYGTGTGGLENVSLGIAAGEKVGLVGRSGAGKSTLIKLLLRFHEAEHGMIELDGQDIRTVTQQSLRRQFSMVGQDAALLHRSVCDNIAYGRTDLPLDAIRSAARQAEADGFILGLRDDQGRTGYDAHVGERGVKLSGGQRQRIALARAILKQAPILILDEATSALDSEVEAIILEKLYALMEKKTVIAIAHRLSTIARMDRIVVLDQGRIAEQGTHAELLKSGGIYSRLWAHQSGEFLGTDL